MAGKGPGPLKSRDSKRRPNATPGFKRLPHEGRDGDPPVWPLTDPSEAETTLWSKLWTLPQAVEWERMRCEDTVALYVRAFIYTTSDPTHLDEKMLSQVRQLDSKIGLSPRAMMDLRWETDEAPLEIEDVGYASNDVHRPYIPPKAESS